MKISEETMLELRKMSREMALEMALLNTILAPAIYFSCRFLFSLGSSQ